MVIFIDKVTIAFLFIKRSSESVRYKNFVNVFLIISKEKMITLKSR